jgi:hypothetical protein
MKAMLWVILYLSISRNSVMAKMCWMYHIHALIASGKPLITLEAHMRGISVVVAFKLMLQNMSSSQSITDNHYPHITAEVL